MQHECMHVHPTWCPSDPSYPFWNGAFFRPGVRGCMSHAWPEKNYKLFNCIYIYMIYIYMYWKSSGTMYTMNLRQASSWTCMHADLYMCVDACWQHACAWLKVCMQKAGHPASSIVWIVSAFTCKEIDIHPVYPCMLWTMLYQASCRWRTLFHLGRPSLVTYYSTRLHQLRDVSISFRPLVSNLLLPIKKDHLAHIYECRSSNWNCASAGFSDMMAALKELQKSENIRSCMLTRNYALASYDHTSQGQIEPKAAWGTKGKLNPKLIEGYTCIKDVHAHEWQTRSSNSTNHTPTAIIIIIININNNDNSSNKGTLLPHLASQSQKIRAVPGKSRIESHACCMVKLNEPGMHARIQAFGHFMLFHFKRCVNKARGHEWICMHRCMGAQQHF